MYTTRVVAVITLNYLSLVTLDVTSDIHCHYNGDYFIFTTKYDTDTLVHYRNNAN